MNVLLTFLWICIFLFLIWKLRFFQIQGFPQWIIIATFGVKLCISLCLDIIYTQYYNSAESDIYKYFLDAKVLFESIHSSFTDYVKILCSIDLESPNIQQYLQNTDYWTRQYDYGFIPENQFIIKANLLIMLFSWGAMGVHYVFADFISFVAYFLIFKTLIQFTNRKLLLFCIVFLFPSSIIWTSGLLKEVFVMLGIGLSIYGFFRCIDTHSWKHYLMVVLGLLLLLTTKLYVFVAILPALLAYCITHIYHISKPFLVYATICILGFITLCIFDFGLHAIPFFENLASKRNDFINTAILENAGSYISIGKIEATISSFIYKTPEAIWNSIALPYVWSCSNLLQIIPSLENVLFFACCIVWMLFPQKLLIDQKNFVSFCICFSLVLLWIVGITTPVIGAIVRYKIPIIPFLYTMFIVLIKQKKEM